MRQSLRHSELLAQAMPIPMPSAYPPIAGQSQGPTPAEQALGNEIEEALDPRPLAKEIGSIINAAVSPGAYDYRERALRAAGIDPASARANNYEVHHIVAAMAAPAQPARDVLSSAGMEFMTFRT